MKSLDSLTFLPLFSKLPPMSASIVTKLDISIQPPFIFNFRRSYMKTVLITGCSTGFGFQAAQVLAARGDTVYATMRDPDGKNLGPANELRAFAKANNADIRVIDLDVCSDNSVDAAAAAVSVSLDVIINR
jgi:NADP-dependent 3-hydroxy acid dehydrogenase YdfG